MEDRPKWEASGEEIDKTEEIIFSQNLSDNLLQSNNHIAHLTERCSQLVGNNTILEQQVDGLRSMLDEARTNVKGFELRLQKQEKNDANIKAIFKQLQDYLFLSHDENMSLNNELERMKKEKQILERIKAEKEVTINEYRKREYELEDMVSTLKGELAKKDENNFNRPSGKCKNHDLEIEELGAEKALLEFKVKNCCIVDEKSEEVAQLTNENMRLSQEIKEVKEKYERCNDEKFQLENDLQRRINEIQAKECDLVDSRTSAKVMEEKVQEREREIATLTQRLDLCSRSNEIAYFEKRKSEDETSNANTLIAELENKIQLQRTASEKFNQEMKSQLDEITKLREANKILKSGLEEMENETQRLRAKLGINNSKKKKLAGRLAGAQEKVRQLEKEIEAKNEKIHDLEREVHEIDSEAAKGREENQALLLKIDEASKLMAESTEYGERKVAELQTFLEDCNFMGQRVNSLQRELEKKEELLETSAQKAKQDQEDLSNEIQKLKAVLKNFQDANKNSNAQLCSLQEQNIALQKEIKGLESENERLHKMLDAMKVDLEHKDKENSCYQERVQEYLAKIDEQDHTRRNRKQSYKNNMKSMKADFEALIAIKEEKIKEISISEGELQKKLEDMRAECERCKKEISKLNEANENSDNFYLTGKGHTHGLLDNNYEVSSKLSAHEVQLNTAINELDTIACLLKECEHLRKINHESVGHVDTLEKNIGNYNERVFSLVEGNSTWNSAQQSLELHEKYVEDQHIRFCKMENDLKKKALEWRKETKKVKRELEEQKATIESLKDQLKKSEHAYENFKNNFTAFSHQNDTEVKILREAETAVQGVTEQLKATEQITAQLKSNLEKTNEVQQELMKHYINGMNEAEQPDQRSKELLEYAAKLEQENDELKYTIENNMNCMKEKEEEFRDEAKNQDEEINSLKRDLAMREKESESISQEYQKLSKEMVDMKMTHSKTLKDLLSQTYVIEELSGSQKYQQIKRKMLKIRADEKEEELIILRKKLTKYAQEIGNIKQRFDYERELRMKMETDVKQTKILYEKQIKDTNILIENTEREKKELQEKTSKQQNDLDVGRKSLEELKIELEKKKNAIENFQKEAVTQKEIIDFMTQKIQEIEGSLIQKSEQNSKLEKILQEKEDSMKRMVKSVDQYKSIIASKESNIDSMRFLLEEKDIKYYELQQALVLKGKEYSKVEKEKLILQKRISLLEESVRKAEQMYNARCSEKRELGESLKNAKCENRKLLDEKEEVKEKKHELELKLLYCGEGKGSTDRSQKIDLEDVKHFINIRKKLQPNSNINEMKTMEDKALKNEGDQCGAEQDLADFSIILYDDNAKEVNDIEQALQQNHIDNEDDELAAIFGLNFICSKNQHNNLIN